MPGNLAFFSVEIDTISNAEYNDTKLASFGFPATNVRVRCLIGTGSIEFSFNGADDSGSISFGAVGGYAASEEFRDIGPVNNVYLKGGAGDETVLVEAW